MHPHGERHRVAIDTNLLVSGALIHRGNPYVILQSWLTNAFEVVSSTSQLAELSEVLSRPKAQTAYKISQANVDNFIGEFKALAVFVEPTSPCIVELRDPDDEVILMSAVAGSAGYLVTGDQDFALGCPRSAPGRIAYRFGRRLRC